MQRRGEVRSAKKGHIGGDKCPDCGGNLFLLREKKQIEKQPFASNCKEASRWEQFRGPEVAGVVIFEWVSKVAAREPGVVLWVMTLNRGCYLLASASDTEFFLLSLPLRRDESSRCSRVFWRNGFSDLQWDMEQQLSMEGYC